MRPRICVFRQDAIRYPNPIGVPAHVDGSDLVLNLSSLTQATKEIPK